MAVPEIGYGRDWWASLSRLDGIAARQVNDAMSIFCTDPGRPGLNLELLNGSRRLHTIRASKSIRILLAREGDVSVFLEAGAHDDIYNRAARMRFVANPATGFVGLVPIDVAGDDEANERRLLAERRQTTLDYARDVVGVLDHWSDAELLEVGFTDIEIGVLRTCAAEDELCLLDLPGDRLELAIDLLELAPEQWRNPSLDPAAEAERRIREVLLASPQSFTQLFPPEEAARIAAAPIEDWMVFLHPDQRAAIERRHSGPARVRGSAGTGKTVVGLHRAAALARRFEADGESGKVLFTTYIKSLPPVFASLFARLPLAAVDQVEFINIDKLAFRICRESGDRPQLEPRAIDAAFASAYRTVVQAGSPLAELSRDYLRTEVQAVIKGRGLRSVEDYLAIDRTGRRTRFTEPLRRQMWLLKEEWDRQMAQRGTIDFTDVILRARDHARRLPAPAYRAAIIDEAQDLTLVGLQLIRALINGQSGDRPDGLMVVGDGAQRIYAGGFTLKQAGIDVRGRTTVLKVNYRNTRQIINAAMAVAGDQVVDDLGDEQRRGDAAPESARDGIKPVLKCCTSHLDELGFVVRAIADLTSSGTMSIADFAVAAATNDQAKQIREALSAAGIECQTLESYDGQPTDAVKVGTHHRIKGLEFKVVFLPFLGAADFPRSQVPGQGDLEYAEATELAVSCLFVAMTRARDGLFLSCSGEPSTVLEPAVTSFEVL
jgi:superfamily I DNA/RNA helicase